MTGDALFRCGSTVVGPVGAGHDEQNLGFVQDGVIRPTSPSRALRGVLDTGGALRPPDLAIWGTERQEVWVPWRTWR